MEDFEKLGVFYLGRPYDLQNKAPGEGLLLYSSKDLVTHAVCIGMTGSGKTGLCICLLEEAILDGIPAIAIDPKGDITNLLLTFPELRADDFAPWINEEDAAKKGLSIQEYARQQSESWKKGLASWNQDGERIRRLRSSADFAIYTPGSGAGMPVSILKSFAAPPREVIEDPELLQERISTTVTSLLGLIGIEADPIQSREHILISTVISEAWKKGSDLGLADLIQRIQNPPVGRIGVLEVESFYPSKERFALAMRLNNLMAAPSFQLWLEGEPLDVDTLLHTASGKPRVSIFYTAHLSDAERMFFTSLLLNSMVGWMRMQSGTTSLRSMLYIDEVFGYLPPVANPPSKLPLLTLLKQARAFGLGVVLATQNPVDLDYKGLSNTGTWFIGRLQTERDKLRVLEALESASAVKEGGMDRGMLDQAISGLGKRIFLMHDVNEVTPVVFETRWAMSYLRGPLTRSQIKVLMDPIKAAKGGGVARPVEPKITPAYDSGGATASVSQRPVLPPDLPEYFIAPSPASAGLTYKPMILGAAEIGFRDAKTKISFQREVVFKAQLRDRPLPVDWEGAKEADLKISDLQTRPVEGARYSELPSAAAKAKNYTQWKKEFADWLLVNQRLELMRSPSLGVVSEPEEGERDFRVRLQQAARERRDEEGEALRKKYASDFAKLDGRIRRAEKILEAQAIQAREKKYDTAVSFGETLLGAVLGRRTVSSASRTARGIGKSMRESREREIAESDLRSLKEERGKLDSRFKAELAALEKKIDPLTEDFERITIPATKSNISVRLVALVWDPG